jgi:hypothetical protein
MVADKPRFDLCGVSSETLGKAVRALMALERLQWEWEKPDLPPKLKGQVERRLKRQAERRVRHDWSVVFMESGSKWLDKGCFIDASELLKPLSLGGHDVFEKDYKTIERSLPPEQRRVQRKPSSLTTI